MQRHIPTPLEDLTAAMRAPKRPAKRRHWLSAAINRLRFNGRKEYSTRSA